MDSFFDDETSISPELGQESWIGRIIDVDYIGHTVKVVIPVDGLSGPRVRVIKSIDLGTKNAPKVTPGQTIRIVRIQDDTYVGIEIDPQTS